MTRLPPRTTGGVKIVAISLVFMGLSIIVFGLRVAAARIQRRQLRPHDYLVFGALVLGLGFGIVSIVGVFVGGSGQHVQQILADPHQGLETVIAGLKNFFAAAFVWACATFLCKLSVLTLYLDLFPKPGFRNAVFVMMGVVVAFWLGLILSGLLICRPIAYNWDRSLDGQCGSTTAEEVGFAVANMIVDGTIVFLPIPVVWKLQMSVKRKIGISCLFGLGFVICVLNAARIGVSVTADEADYSYALINVVVFSGLEIWFGIIAACAPTLRPVFVRNRKSQRKLSYHSDYQVHMNKRQHLNSGYPNGTGTSWELESNSRERQWDGLGEAPFEGLDDDDLPLTNDPAFPKTARGAETSANIRSQRDESRSGRKVIADPDNVRVRTDISVSSAPNHKM